LTYERQIDAAAGPRLFKFAVQTAKELGADQIRRKKLKLRCGQSAADQSEDE
jgi:hypothetical protein